MKKIFWLIIIGFIQLYPQKTTINNMSPDTTTLKLEKYGTPVIDPYTGSIDEKDSSAVLIKSDRIVQRFSTIKLAIESADANSTIIVYPGTYSDSLTITTENITIKGISNGSVTISGAVYVTASRGRIETCTLTGNLTLIGQTAKALYYIKDCHLENNINVGTASTPITSNALFIDCLLGKDAAWTTKTIYINKNGSGGPDILFNQCYGPVWIDSHNLYIDGYSKVTINGGTKLVFHSITINGGTGFDKVPSLYFNNMETGIMNLTLNGWTEIACESSRIIFYSSGSTISNHCELDLFNCFIGGATSLNINFNSSLPSRFTHCTGTTNILAIIGTGLANLHIQHSLFQQPNAPIGLGSDDTNTWGAWVDY